MKAIVNELILNAAGDGIYGVDNEGRGSFANPAAIEMLGWTLDEIVGTVVVFRDITERKVAEEALRRLQEKERLAAVGEFAATIAHEIRNPLSTITMALEYLHTVGQTEKAQRRLDLAASEVKRLERLLSDLLLLARPNQMNKRELNLNGLIEETLDNLQSAPPILVQSMGLDTHSSRLSRPSRPPLSSKRFPLP
jgi:signal transduction histidine kinase